MVHRLRECIICHKHFKRRKNERPHEYNIRKYCSHKCSAKGPRSPRGSVVKTIISIKKQGWSKYGGERAGLIKETLVNWYCQACGDEQSKELPQFMYQLPTGDYVRLCTFCYANARITDSFENIKELRHRFDNLLSFDLKPFHVEKPYFGTSFLSLSALD